MLLKTGGIISLIDVYLYYNRLRPTCNIFILFHYILIIN